VQNVANFQYELPEDFEDEWIDEEMAFTEEDKLLMAEKGGGAATAAAGGSEDEDEEGEELTRDDFSDDVRPILPPSLAGLVDRQQEVGQ